ncbi:fatty acyl-AMP ligase [Streptomyces sp. NPDC003247]|uniref:fatty acyl-AMP ligase n=1 Tax=Streptomyces sp. NPDC003247 TaxID=3364677 RepID=UPI0036AB2906
MRVQRAEPATPTPTSEAPSPRTLSGLLRRCADRRGDEPAVTHLDHSRVRDGVATTVTWRELDERADAVAAWIRPRASAGDRAAVMCAQSIDYLASFLGVIRAGLIAVPLFPPGDARQWQRLSGVLADCAPALLLTTWREVHAVQEFAGAQGFAEGQVVAVDALPAAGERIAEPVRTDPDDIAYLQYTSGSTRAPAGVMVSHRNVLVNCRQVLDTFGMRPGHTVNVSWLPLFHDMGLVIGLAAPVVSATRAVLMDPEAFLADPARWLRAMSANPGAITAAPSFAYAYAATRVTEADRALLNLDHVVALIDGSEPILPANIELFRAAFTDCGLPPHAHRPAYGLAEATVLVSASPAGEGPRMIRLDRDALAAGHAVEAEGASGVKGGAGAEGAAGVAGVEGAEGAAGAAGVEGAAGAAGVATLVGCGLPAGQRIRITDPVTAAPLPEARVGEIWVSGGNVGLGYWGRPQETAAVFVEDGEGRWLRTGDLGVIVDGHLCITGRIKDLVVLDGRNHYPQDIELTVERAHPGVRRHAVAAFGVPTDDGERLVLLAERAKGVDPDAVPDSEIIATVRTALTDVHGIGLHAMVLLGPGEVPRTSSGKISRSGARARFLRNAS